MPAEKRATRPLVEPASRAEWREWLQEHHADSSGVWLAVGKRGNPVTTLSYNDAVEEALCFGWIDSTVNRLDEHRYRQLFTPRKPSSTWARSNKERVERLIAAGLMTPAGMAAIETAKHNGSWETLDRLEDLAVPEDLATELARVPEAAERFSAMSASKRRMVLYWIADAKRDETRQRRIARTVEAVAEGRMPV